MGLAGGWQSESERFTPGVGSELKGLTGSSSLQLGRTRERRGGTEPDGKSRGLSRERSERRNAKGFSSTARRGDLRKAASRYDNNNFWRWKYDEIWRHLASSKGL